MICTQARLSMNGSKKASFLLKYSKILFEPKPTKQASFARQTNLARLFCFQPNKPFYEISQPKPKASQESLLFLNPTLQPSKQAKAFLKPSLPFQSSKPSKAFIGCKQRRAKRAKESEQGEKPNQSKQARQSQGKKAKEQASKPSNKQRKILSWIYQCQPLQ